MFGRFPYYIGYYAALPSGRIKRCTRSVCLSVCPSRASNVPRNSNATETSSLVETERWARVRQPVEQI